jgi:hypothetical protein
MKVKCKIIFSAHIPNNSQEAFEKFVRRTFKKNKIGNFDNYQYKMCGNYRLNFGLIPSESGASETNTLSST